MNYPTLTLHAPWADLIASGWKTLETRRHDRFAGLVGKWIAIHQGLAFDAEAERSAIIHLPRNVMRPGDERVMQIVADSRGRLGLVVAVGYVDCGCWYDRRRRGWAAGDWDVGREQALCEVDGLYGLRLRDAYALAEPVQARGQQYPWPWRATQEALDWMVARNMDARRQGLWTCAGRDWEWPQKLSYERDGDDETGDGDAGVGGGD